MGTDPAPVSPWEDQGGADQGRSGQPALAGPPPEPAFSHALAPEPFVEQRASLNRRGRRAAAKAAQAAVPLEPPGQAFCSEAARWRQQLAEGKQRLAEAKLVVCKLHKEAAVTGVAIAEVECEIAECHLEVAGSLAAACS